MIGWRTMLGRQLLIRLAPFATDADALACGHRLADVMSQVLEELHAKLALEDHELN